MECRFTFVRGVLPSCISGCICSQIKPKDAINKPTKFGHMRKTSVWQAAMAKMIVVAINSQGVCLGWSDDPVLEVDWFTEACDVACGVSNGASTGRK